MHKHSFRGEEHMQCQLTCVNQFHSAQLCPETPWDDYCVAHTIHPKQNCQLLSVIWQSLYVIGIQGKQI